MKKINLLYIASIPLAFFLYYMNLQLSQSSAFFYGFAENKETELSHDKSVLIHQILVTPGQEVSKGQLLMEVRQSTMDFKLDNVNHDLERLTLLAQQQKQNLRDRIQQLQTKRKSRVAEIEVEIRNLESSIQFNKDLYKDLKTIAPQTEETKETPSTIRLKALKESLALVTEPIDVEIAQLETALTMIKTPSQVQKQKLKGEREFLEQEQEKLSILAPSEGIIGNILCKEGENISAFSTLINFYERNPTLVKGFVHESLILKVQAGDSLLVSSSLHPEHHIQGKVIGLGSRIVEIPERLRKIPDFKTYGREVLISIPAKNSLLQKEKVMLNSLDHEASNSFVFSFFNSKQQKNNTKSNKLSSVR